MFSAGHIVAMVTFCATKLTETCSPMIGQLFNTTILASNESTSKVLESVPSHLKQHLVRIMNMLVHGRERAATQRRARVIEKFTQRFLHAFFPFLSSVVDHNIVPPTPRKKKPRIRFLSDDIHATET